MMGLFKQLVTTLSLTYHVLASQVTTTSFSNKARFLFDTDGNQVDAYGSKINFFAGKYYLYGNSFANSQGSFAAGVASFPAGYGIKSYSSVDLVNWAYEGFLYDPASTTPCNAPGGCGRPHILYHADSQKYILWANAGSDGYVIATSSLPSSGFVFLNATAQIPAKFDGLQPADFSVESFGMCFYSKVYEWSLTSQQVTKHISCSRP